MAFSRRRRLPRDCFAFVGFISSIKDSLLSDEVLDDVDESISKAIQLADVDLGEGDG